MKKIIAIFLSLVMILAFTACSGGNTPANTTEGGKNSEPAQSTEKKQNETEPPAPVSTEKKDDPVSSEEPGTEEPYEDPSEIVRLKIDTYEVGETIEEEFFSSSAQGGGQLPTIMQDEDGNKYINFRSDDTSGTEHDCKIQFSQSTTELFGDKYTVEFRLRIHEYKDYEYSSNDVLFEIQPKGITVDFKQEWYGNCRTIRFFANGTMQSMGSTQAYKYNFDEWFTISITYNFEDDEIKIYYNGNLAIESGINLDYVDGLIGHAYMFIGQPDMKVFPFNYDVDDVILHAGLEILADKGGMIDPGEFQTNPPAESEAETAGAE